MSKKRKPPPVKALQKVTLGQVALVVGILSGLFATFSAATEFYERLAPDVCEVIASSAAG